jgi:hypothetical protein
VPKHFAWTVATALSGLALVLVVLNAFLILGNESRQAEVNQRQQYINQSVQLARVSQALVSALAQAAVKSDDKDIRELLTSSGITIQVNPPAQPDQPSPATAPTKPAGK